MANAATYPIYNRSSGWNALLPKRTIKTPVDLDASYEFVIIGAGYTGLAVARRLAELSSPANILLIEATEIGEGASARNSGFILTVPFLTSHSSRSTHTSETETAIKQIRFYGAGLQWLKASVDAGGIECDWDDVGKYHAAATDDGAAGIKALAKHYRQCGVTCAEIDPQDFAGRIGTPYYKYALHTGNNVYVQPAALVRGLADTLPANVTLLERTPVLSLSGEGPFTVETPGRTIRARKVVIANNGFAQRLGFFNDRLFNIYTYAGLTPELDDEQLAAHGTDQNWGITPAARAGTTLRRPIGRRFMVRSLHSYEAEESVSSVEAKLMDSYQRRYPHLRSHRFEYVWGGAVGLTRNAATCFGKVADHLYASVGCNGAGIMKGTTYGKLLAEVMMGLESQDSLDVQNMNSPSWLPPDPILRWGVTIEMKRMKKLAGAER